MVPNIDKINPVFPDPQTALTEPDGLLCMGGNLQPNTLLTAYKQGIFPWYNDGQPILWWSPNPRMVIFPENIHISKSLKKWNAKKIHSCTWNSCFSQVIQMCARRTEGTWITNSMINAYIRLFLLKFAYSLEIWNDSRLVGGLYGVAIGKMFFGESMFSLEKNASKIALMNLAQSGNFSMIDCQFHTQHLESMGAVLLERSCYLEYLAKWIN